MSDSEREMLYCLLGEAVALMPADSVARQQWLRDVLHETESVHAPRPSLFERREEDLFDLYENRRADPYFDELEAVLSVPRAAPSREEEALQDVSWLREAATDYARQKMR